MKENDVFNLDKYDEAYKFISKNVNFEIKDLGNKQYKIVRKQEPTIEEQNEVIRAKREQLYVQTSDVIRNDFLEALARGSENAEELKQAWLESKDKIRAENPYIQAESNKIESEVIENGLQREEKEINIKTESVEPSVINSILGD